VLNGCLLEGVALALEGRFDSFSEGRGRITEAKLEEIWSIASRHGITLAPLLGPGGVSVEEAAT
jgi:predicted amino acid dehydrogenase